MQQTCMCGFNLHPSTCKQFLDGVVMTLCCQSSMHHFLLLLSQHSSALTALCRKENGCLHRAFAGTPACATSQPACTPACTTQRQDCHPFGRDNTNHLGSVKSGLLWTVLAPLCVHQLLAARVRCASPGLPKPHICKQCICISASKYACVAVAPRPCVHGCCEFEMIQQILARGASHHVTNLADAPRCLLILQCVWRRSKRYFSG